MTRPEPLVSRLEAWLGEGGHAAPKDLVEEVLEAFPSIPQRRPRGLGRWLPHGRLALPMATAAAIVVIAATAARFGPELGVGGPPSPTPGWAQRFPTQYVASFVRPFSYAIDPASGLQATQQEPDIIQFRIVSPTDPESLSRGVIVRTAGDGLRSAPCSDSGGTVMRKPGPQDVIAYFRQLAGFEAGSPSIMTVDGRQALWIDVRQLAERPCTDMFVFDGCGCTFTNIDGGVRRVIALDVDGETILLVIPAEDGDIARSLLVSLPFIDSMHFTGPAPTDSLGRI